MIAPSTLDWGVTWPQREEFESLGATHRVVPVVRRVLADALTPVAVYEALAQSRPGTFILESAEPDGTHARYSFVGVRSSATLSVVGDEARWTGNVPAGLTDGTPLHTIAQALDVLATERIGGLPPLTGGLVGAIGWDIIRQWEPTLPADAARELDVPDAVLCLATDLAAIDHRDGSVWLIANAVNVDGSDDRIESAYDDAVARLDGMQAGLAAAAVSGVRVIDPAAPSPTVSRRSDSEGFRAAVRRSKEAIRDGEVFQIVPSQRFDVDTDVDPLEVYRVLRTLNPSPYMYFFRLDSGGREYAVVGASPESLVTVHDRAVSTFPIAGSRPRGTDAEQDAKLEAELAADPKENAEHLMLVDLARNDLTKVCLPTSVEVTEFKHINRYSHIMHMCSTVAGELEGDATALDAFTAVFPAGTLSGAPKPRAIALIDELEPARRGFYGGAVGYFDFAGNADTAIAIRTALISDGVAHVQAGAGIVADSDPDAEDAETVAKAEAVIRAIDIASRLTRAAS